MKKSKFTETQIVAVLKQADAGIPIKDICRYNEERPHDSLGDLTPTEYRQQVAGSSTFEVSA